MGSVKKSKNEKVKKNSAGFYLVTIVPLTLVFCLVLYLIIQGIAERLGLSPVIVLGISSTSWMSSGEAVLMFVLWLGISITLGSICSLLLIRKLAGD